MASTTHDILLRFLLDESSKQKTQAGADALNKKLEETEKHVHDINRAGYDAGLVRAMDDAAKVAKNKLNPALVQAVKHEKEFAEAAKHAAHEAHLQMQVFDAQAMLLSARASQMTKRASELTRISSRLGQVSRFGLVAGGAVVGGIFAEANRYAKEVEGTEKATRATREWTEATKQLGEARGRVDAVLLREALPLLQKAAQLANQAASFVEKHPQIVEASLKIGTIVAGLSAVGLAVTKGIQLHADRLYLAAVPIQLQAAQLMEASAAQMLVAAHLQAEASGVQVAEGLGGKGAVPAGGGPGLLNMIGLVVAGIVASGAVVTVVDQVLEGSGFGQERRSAIDRARDQGSRIYPGILPPNERELQAQLNRAQTRGDTQEIARLREELDRLGDQSKATADDLAQAVTGLAGSANEAQIVSAFTKWKEDDARLISEASENRKKIIANTEKQIADATQKYAQQRASINRQADKARADIIKNFAANSKKEEVDYAKARADIVKDAGREIEKIEQQHQERIRKLTLEHNDRVEELTAARDALGLAKEMRRFDRERSEAERETNQEIAERRRDVAIRLQELAAQFAAERAQRQVDFEEQLAENAKNRQEQLAEAAQAHAAELQQIRVNKAQQLRELQEGLIAERRRRRETFIAEIRDLDASLLGERNLKNRYYSLMLADAEKFFAAYRARLGGSTASALSSASGSAGGYPAHDYSGMAYTGIYRMAANGQPQYVLSGESTRAAEQMIGGRLTQDALLSALARGAGSSRSLTIQDNSRFDGRISSAQVRAIKRETRDEVVREFLGDA